MMTVMEAVRATVKMVDSDTSNSNIVTMVEYLFSGNYIDEN